MEKESAILEITSSSIKITVGYEIEDKPYIIYAASKSIEGMIEYGNIIDKKGIISVVESLCRIEDSAAKLRITINDVVLVLPPLGLEIYQGEQTTSVVSEKYQISKLDINNVIKLVKNQVVPHNNEIVDIVPDSFKLEQGRTFTEPPLNEISRFLTVKSKVHTLPRTVINEFRNIVESAGIRIKRIVVSPYCVSRLYANEPTLPTSFIYLDCGSQITSATIISNGAIFNSCYFFGGGKKLIDLISENLSTNKDESEHLIKLYGYDPRKLTYTPVVYVGKNADGTDKKYTINDLNNCTLKYLDDYVVSIKTCLNEIKKVIPSNIDLPIVIGGGFSKLGGLHEFLQEKLKPIKIYRAPMNVIGARDEAYINCVGAILTISKYRGTLEDNSNRVTPITRENTAKTNSQDDEFYNDVI